MSSVARTRSKDFCNRLCNFHQSNLLHFSATTKANRKPVRSFVDRSDRHVSSSNVNYLMAKLFITQRKGQITQSLALNMFLLLNIPEIYLFGLKTFPPFQKEKKPFQEHKKIISTTKKYSVSLLKRYFVHKRANERLHLRPENRFWFVENGRFLLQIHLPLVRLFFGPSVLIHFVPEKLYKRKSSMRDRH